MFRSTNGGTRILLQCILVIKVLLLKCIVTVNRCITWAYDRIRYKLLSVKRYVVYVLVHTKVVLRLIDRYYECYSIPVYLIHLTMVIYMCI